MIQGIQSLSAVSVVEARTREAAEPAGFQQRGEKAAVKISVLMVDGGFRENIFGAEYFSRQDYPEDQYEVLWVEYFDRLHPGLADCPKVRTVTLNRSGIYHSSYCFNAGIQAAKGDVLVIPDADQIVMPDFLQRVAELHRRYIRLVAYGYRLDEARRGDLCSHTLHELQQKCELKNPSNYGGCLTVRKEWLSTINGYEQHPIFRSGNHANGLDVYTRLRNLGLAVQWEPSLLLYHPWHDFTCQHTSEHEAQQALIEWRRQNVQSQAFDGLNPARNAAVPPDAERILQVQMAQLDREAAALSGLQPPAVSAMPPAPGVIPPVPAPPATGSRAVPQVIEPMSGPVSPMDPIQSTVDDLIRRIDGKQSK